MTKKDYITSAKHMAVIRMTSPTDAWCATLDMLCEIFRNDNPRFDEDKYREACYVEPEPTVREVG
jgi:hypothetical protein